MNSLDLSRYALSVCAAATMLTACGFQAQSPLPQSSAAAVLAAATRAAFVKSFAPTTSRATIRELFISNGSRYNTIDVFSVPGYKKIGSITNGVSSALGLWVDQSGDLYAANGSGKNVTEYAPGSHSLTCSYSIAEGRPQYVTTNDEGFVYVTSTKVINKFNIQGYVYEFQHCGSEIKRYNAAGPVGGVAVDADGNVFVRLAQTAQFSGGLEEFKRGKTKPTPLVSLKGGGGLVIDKNKRLIASDSVYYIYVISPPYKSARKLTASASPIGLSLDRSESLLFTATHYTFYHYHSYAQILSYPSGRVVGSVNTNEAASGVAISPDATF